ncbi:MAG: DUF1801 domain-containing protein [Jiangellales bacterium]
MGTVDDLIAGQDEARGSALQHVLDLAMDAAPEAEQGMSYGVPALRYRGRPLLGFNAWDTHLAIYPFSPAAIDPVRDQLHGFSVSKGTVRFTVENPLPDQAVTGIVVARQSELDGA